MNPKTHSRRLRRFFSSKDLPRTGEETLLPVSESSHLRDVLRLEVGACCLITDGKGRQAQARIAGFRKDGSARLVIGEISADQNAERLVMHAFAALPQKGKMDDLIEKAQELGVDEIMPVETRRTVVKMSQASWPKVRDRWMRIAREAAKQSGSLKLLQIHGPVSFEKALKAVGEKEQAAVFDPGGREPFREWALGLKPDRPVSLFWGPEGGFSEEEIVLARKCGIPVVNLTDTVLKVDTAFVGVISALRFLWG